MEKFTVLRQIRQGNVVIGFYISKEVLEAFAEFVQQPILIESNQGYVFHNGLWYVCEKM